MYAIVKTGGKQYKVSTGDCLNVEKLEGEAGDKVALTAITVVDGAKVIADPAEAAKTKVEATIVEQFKGGKQLVFDVTGSDITSGTQVSVSIGQRSQNYDTIVPNSALRSDSNGSFVLVIVAKSSPLGNRFVATRVDVTELAKDDVNTAVSGGLSAYDMVLTTATKPVEDGMLVRLPD